MVSSTFSHGVPHPPTPSPQRPPPPPLYWNNTSCWAVCLPQVTFDVAWSPDCIDGRCYDAVGLANACDFLVVMSYDEQSQITEGPCVAKANSPLEQTEGGMWWIKPGCRPRPYPLNPNPFPEATPDPSLTLTQILDLTQGRIGTWPATEQDRIKPGYGPRPYPPLPWSYPWP